MAAPKKASMTSATTGAARLTLYQFVDTIDGFFGSSDEFSGGARMRHYSSIADSQPGQLSSSAPEP